MLFDFITEKYSFHVLMAPCCELNNFMLIFWDVYEAKTQLSSLSDLKETPQQQVQPFNARRTLQCNTAKCVSDFWDRTLPTVDMFNQFEMFLKIHQKLNPTLLCTFITPNMCLESDLWNNQAGFWLCLFKVMQYATPLRRDLQTESLYLIIMTSLKFSEPY